MELLIVTGLSGAGKSQAIHTLEDIGYFCFDNIPAELLLVSSNGAESGPAGRFAAVLDVRSNAYSGDVGESVQTLAEAGYAVKVLFLDAADDVLLRRYKETRRPHPLIHGEVYTLAQALVVERQLLASVREHADYLARHLESERGAAPGADYRPVRKSRGVVDEDYDSVVWI